MTQVIVYLSGAHEYVVRKGFRQTCLDYAAAQGLGELKSDQYSEEAVPGAILQEVMQRASPGSHLVTNSLASFGLKPSEQRTRIRELQGRDVTVHIIGMGPIDSHLAVLKACWDAAAPLEAALEQLEKDYATHEAQLAERMSRFEDRLVARLSEVKGHQAVREFYGVNGNTPEQPAEVTDETALHVRGLREAKGLSQEQLATAAGVSKSQIQRIETSGRGTEIARVLSVLEHEGWQPQAPTKWVEEQGT
jgi:ribosome-binding protein aMBF1 (putative translation factor)